MGTWSTEIRSNDTFQDIYQTFFDLYNQGEDPNAISKKIQEDFAEMFGDYEEKNNSLFALALAQWETKSLEHRVFEKVKEIIVNGRDIEAWKVLGADNKILQKRQKQLEKFLLQISKGRENPKRRVKPKFNYSSVELLVLQAPDGQKTFEVIESYINGKYENTNSGILWSRGGGTVFYFHTKGKFVTANWLDSQTLEIRHDKTIEFKVKNETFYFCGDKGVIKYIPE